MVKDNYNIEYLPSFDEELGEIVYYITYKLQNEIATERLLENIENAIVSRGVNPEGFEVYRSVKDRKYNWYII